MAKLTSGKSMQKALMFMPYRKPPKSSLNRAMLSFRSCKCIKLASRSAMLSLSSANCGSRLARGKSELEREAALPEGVVCEARREVRDGGRSGVVGRDGKRLRLPDRVREWEEVRSWRRCCEAGVAVAAMFPSGVAAKSFSGMVYGGRDLSASFSGE